MSTSAVGSSGTSYQRTVLRHYDAFFEGPAALVAEDRLEEHALAVVRYGPASPDVPYVYLTLGMGQYAQREPHEPRDEAFVTRTELLAYASGEHDEIARSLLALARYPARHETAFGYRHTIAGSPERGFVTGSPLSDVLLCAPQRVRAGFTPATGPDGELVMMVWVVPVHRPERLYAVRHGCDALLRRLGQAGADAADLWRPSVVAD